MDVEEHELIAEISKKSRSVTSSASDTKVEFRSSQSLNFTNTGTEISVESGTGKMAESKLEYWILCLALLVFSGAHLGFWEGGGLNFDMGAKV